ncbi:MAG: YceI family protein [Desulfuromonadales bacterium]
MRHFVFLILLFACISASAAAVELPGTCQVEFTGSSTLHDFDGTAACNPFTLTVTDAGDEAQLGEVTLSVPVTGMRTGIARRDRTMYEMFQAGRFPEITSRLTGAPLAEVRRQLHRAAGGTSTLPLTVRIRDIERPVAARVTGLVDTTRAFNVDLGFSLSLAAFRLPPPVVLGFIRVGDEVRVRVSVQVAPLPTPWQP